ncbi:MAG TPA: mandelate racemase/muconate lactonizing enzyme family protein [Anaeromyxobacter sp.]|nr:mandelate racemase/muconate lactonizing enzyme family protein [Anaeromyxobacter sp.]HTP28029.1 mandelate racemase/muconate lactonizing enzyme family protein [Anaeromyxobacteraceae bacterium]
MKIEKVETFLANAGLRNYLFLRLTTDTGITGVGEASLEWQEKTVETLCHEWLVDRIVGRDPFAIEALAGDLIRDQYQGGSTVMTAISGVELALWDIVGKACGQPVYQLLGGRYHRRIPAYANGWYGGARSPKEYAERAREAVARGYRALKFDPLGTAWMDMAPAEMEEADALVASVREAVGPEVQLMMEFHGRLSAPAAMAMIARLSRYQPAWFEEPVPPERIDALHIVKEKTGAPISAGERLYTMADFERIIALRAVDVLQPDVAHCGGLSIARRIAALAEQKDIRIAPHCSVGPVSLAACLHFDVATPCFLVQETFAEFDVPWRNAFVRGWNPIRNGELHLGDEPGLGLELDEAVVADHPYRKNSFPSLWDKRWLKDFTQDRRPGERSPS